MSSDYPNDPNERWAELDPNHAQGLTEHPSTNSQNSREEGAHIDTAQPNPTETTEHGPFLRDYQAVDNEALSNGSEGQNSPITRNYWDRLSKRARLATVLVAGASLVGIGSQVGGGEKTPDETTVEETGSSEDQPFTAETGDQAQEETPSPAEPIVPDNTETPGSTSNPDEAGAETFDEIYWKTMWDTEAASIQGPEGDERTHQVMGNLTADLIGRIASTRQAENEQEASLSSRIQNIQGATYFIESGDAIIKVEDPVVYGLLHQGDGTLSYSWQANREGRENYTLFYRQDDEWRSFVISEYNDARWFSDRGARLVGAAYKDEGPVIREGRMSQASLQADDGRIIIDTDGFGAVTIPDNPERFDSIDEVIDTLQADPKYRLNGLLTISDDIRKG